MFKEACFLHVLEIFLEIALVGYLCGMCREVSYKSAGEFLMAVQIWLQF